MSSADPGEDLPLPPCEDEVVERDSVSEDELPSDLAADARLERALAYKERGNQKWAEGRVEFALKRWNKGAECLAALNTANTGDEQVKCLLVSLHGNAAMANIKLQCFREAISSANAALAIEPDNEKCLFRRGVARRQAGDTKDAKADFTKILKRNPKQVDSKRQLLALKKEEEAERKRFAGFLSKGDGAALYEDKAAEESAREEQRKADEATKRLREAEEQRVAAIRAEEELKARRARWENDCVARLADNQPVVDFDEWNEAEKAKERAEKARKDAEEAARKAEEAAAKERERQARAAASAVEVVEDEEELIGVNMRGYKTTADGRRTTYFNNDMDAHAKSLIGDIAPRRIDDPMDVDPSPVSAAQPQKTEVVSRSAWNAAGTWEEKNMTSWATASLERALLACRADTDVGSLEVDKVANLDGDAHIAQVRGKVMHIFELSFKVEATLTVHSEPVRMLKASLDFPEVSGDCAGEYETRLTVLGQPTEPDRRLLREWVDNPSKGLRPLLIAAVGSFVAEFRAVAPA